MNRCQILKNEEIDEEDDDATTSDFSIEQNKWIEEVSINRSRKINVESKLKLKKDHNRDKKKVANKNDGTTKKIENEVATHMDMKNQELSRELKSRDEWSIKRDYVSKNDMWIALTRFWKASNHMLFVIDKLKADAQILEFKKDQLEIKIKDNVITHRKIKNLHVTGETMPFVNDAKEHEIDFVSIMWRDAAQLLECFDRMFVKEKESCANFHYQLMKIMGEKNSN